MSYKTFSFTVSSGVGWLGEIPSHWEVVPAKALFSLRAEKALPNDIHLTPSQKFGVLPQAEYMEITGSRVVQNLTESGQMKHVEPNDFVSHLRSFQGGLELSRVRGKVSGAYTVLKPRSDQNPEFWGYALKSATYIQALQTTTDQLRDGQSIRLKEFSQIALPLVPRAEQDAIVEFLDRELEQIDSLVENQEKLIELLANRKASSIAEAVTGASLDCQFTESPLPWLKRFPSVWKRGRVKQVGQVKLGKMIQQESKSVEDVLVPYLSSTSVQETGISVDQEKKMWASPQELVDLRIKKDDVLVLEGGAAGRSFRAGEDIEGVVFQNSLNRVRLDKGKVTPKFFDYWMSYLVSRGVVEAVCNKATIMHLTAEKLKDLPVLIPSLEEQVEITNHLDKLIEHSDRLTDRAQTVLNVLAERRATLIFAAVTGKLELKGGPDG